MSGTSGSDTQTASMLAPFSLRYIPGCGDPISSESMPRSICPVTPNSRRTAQGTRKSQFRAVHEGKVDVRRRSAFDSHEPDLGES